MHQIIHQDHSEAEVVEEPRQLISSETASNGATDSNRKPAAETDQKADATDKRTGEQSGENNRNKRKKRKKRKRRR